MSSCAVCERLALVEREYLTRQQLVDDDAIMPPSSKVEEHVALSDIKRILKPRERPLCLAEVTLTVDVQRANDARREIKRHLERQESAALKVVLKGRRPFVTLNQHHIVH